MLGVTRSRGIDYYFNPKLRPLSRVELHVHLDGSIRAETIWDLSMKKNIPLPGKGTLEELKDYLICKAPEALGKFLSRFPAIIAPFKGDLEALRRIGYEFVEDCYKSGIIYSEARFCPHLFVPDNVIAEQTEFGSNKNSRDWCMRVAAALIEGITRGEGEFGNTVNLIATCIRGLPPVWHEEVLELAANRFFHHEKIVGIDVAGSETTADEMSTRDDAIIHTFERALRIGVHRTCHAGESGPAAQVKFSLEALHAERIGHGYRICSDKDLYKHIQEEQVHLECCPWSSLLTTAVSPSDIPHPIVNFFKDDFNVSVNTDDTTVTGTNIDDEYRLLRKWGLCELHFVKANFNAARSSFLPEAERRDLLTKLGKIYGSSLV